MLMDAQGSAQGADGADVECPHFNTQTQRGAQTCTDCGMQLSMEMSNESGVGNLWGGAAGRTMSGKNITAKTMVQELSSRSEQKSSGRRSPTQRAGKAAKSMALPRTTAALAPKARRVAATTANRLAAPKREKSERPRRNDRPRRDKGASDEPRDPPPQHADLLDVSALDSADLLPAPVASASVDPSPVASASVDPSPASTKLVPLPAGFTLARAVHCEADRLFQLIAAQHDKPLRQSKMRDILLFACVFNAHERLGLPRSPSDLLKQGFVLTVPEMAKGLTEFNSLCPREERRTAASLSVVAELAGLLAPHFSDEAVLRENVDCATQIWASLANRSPMFQEAETPLHGRLRLAMGLAHYYLCFIAPSAPQRPLLPPANALLGPDLVMEVSREIDRLLETHMFEA